MNNNRGLDIIIPVNIDANWFDIKEIESDILYQYKEYGFTRFGFCLPAAGWRRVGYPPLALPKCKHCPLLRQGVGNFCEPIT